MIYSKVKGKNLQPGILYPERISFRIEGKRESPGKN